jgi:hypothetical protein
MDFRTLVGDFRIQTIALRTVGTITFGASLVLPGCLHRDGTEKDGSTPMTSSASPSFSDGNLYDFCQIKGSQVETTSVRPWGAEMVQKAISDLIALPTIKNTAWSAYPVAYRKMTAERDKARCSGSLVNSDPRINLINHHLSDIMTRWLVLETGQCAAMPQSAMPGDGLCGVLKWAARDKLDALSEALASTAVYISSHIAISLSAVIMEDAFWDAFPGPNTHRGARSLDSVLEARLTWVKTYKPTFDLFNPFLADNLKTVADALKKAGLIKGNTLNLALYMAKILPCKADLFGSIRDKAFDTAVSYTKDPLLSRHPMLKAKDGGYVLDYGRFNFQAPLPKAVKNLEDFAITAVANPLSLKMYRDILGGVKPEELEGAAPNGCPL